MEKKQETMSNWSCVTQLLESEQRPIELGKYHSCLTHQAPGKMLSSLSYYKFAAKMIGTGKHVLDVGCNEGLGSWVVAKECGYCKGIDCDQEAIEVASRNFQDPTVTFEALDFLAMPPEIYDATISFDVIEHIDHKHSFSFIKKLADSLTDRGVTLIGTANGATQKGPINLYSSDKLYNELSSFFEHVFLFAANEELIHTGSLPLASYFIALCCRPKR
jgi:2-polyprenyl-3-methyl-5-hydroxy-6-metoxy-1,4-benzoquinol methylase